ncbi:M48 family metallopeptidase [Fimbriiglobus ruber]|nr:M48 family metallopeptidase [Fimbriiglobus ruber]
MQQWRALGLAMICAGMAAGCGRIGVPGADQTAGPGGREQPLALNPKQELALGHQSYEEVMSEYGDRVLSADSPETTRVRRIVDRLKEAADIEPLQREIELRVRGYRFDWEANVIRDKQVNAFCLPAGKIFVFTGILSFLRNDDDAVAAVLAHEMAHAQAHHSSERLARERAGGNVFQKLSYSRMQESEADHIGVFIMAFAGYDPDRAVAFWKRMTQAHNGPPEFLSDHPSDEHRVQNLTAWAPKARAAKKAFDEGRITPPRR